MQHLGLFKPYRKLLSHDMPPCTAQVFVHFLPHFKTLPEPPAGNDDEVLLRSRDAATRDGLRRACACVSMHACMLTLTGSGC